ncbi:MAG TPA: choice-of-anchor X domain-containing protein, partial [Anaerolineae bacterium]|nr:choice-of-anchor X domain-containing protein [Anaerolineae bacterium]
MNRRKLSLFVVLSAGLILALSLPALSDTPAAVSPKQVAAPPSEFVTGKLNLPDPKQAGVRSQWAMLPVELQPAADGSWSWAQVVPIDNAQDFALLVLSPDRAAWDVRVETPDRVELNLKDADRLAGIDHSVGQLGEGAAQYPGDVYTFSGYASGEWTVRVSSATAPASKAAPSGYLLVTDRQSPYRLFSHLSSYDLLAGHEVGLVTAVYDDRARSESSLPIALRVKLDVEIRLHFPNGEELATPMVDDGQHADGQAGDGVYGGLVKVPTAGQYTAQVVARGQTPEGQPFLRTSEHVFPVIEAGLTLQGIANAEAQDASTLRIPVIGKITGKLPGTLQVA